MNDDGRNVDALLEQVWRWMLDDSPELATYVGEPTVGALTDYSPKACEARRATRRRLLEDVRAVDAERLDGERRVSCKVVEAFLAAQVAVDAFPHEGGLVDQINGVHLRACESLEEMPLSGRGDHDAYLQRLHALPLQLDQVTVALRQPTAQAARPPRVALADVPRQLVEMAGDGSPLLEPLQRAGVPADVLQRAEEALRDAVGPALDRFRGFVVDELVPSARDDVALGALPDGEAWYQALITEQTSLSLSPQEIHEIGLAEVARIRAEMEELAREVGVGSVVRLRDMLHDDESWSFRSADEQLQTYRALCKEIDACLWKVVGTVPRMPYGVEPMPAYMAASAPAAYYMPGAGRSRRPAKFVVNSYDLPSRPRWAAVALALHEAVPGHHLQHAVADELGLPPIRRHLPWNAYVEGWGLYAEHLGMELGLYRTIGDRYGRLAFDMWRAARLVVDTGLHALGWARAEAMSYLRETTGLGEQDVVAEVDRYIAWPAQALGYKLGERTIHDLRRQASTLLGEHFQLTAFHDTILQLGPVPLPVLHDQLVDWATAQATHER